MNMQTVLMLLLFGGSPEIFPPPSQKFRITQDSKLRITQDGSARITTT